MIDYDIAGDCFTKCLNADQAFMIYFYMEGCPACEKGKDLLGSSPKSNSIILINVNDPAVKHIAISNEITAVPTAVIISPNKNKVYPFISGYNEQTFNQFIDNKFD